MTQHLEQRNENTFDGWLTPEWVLDLVRKMGPIGLDPCTEESNPVRATTFLTSGGLEDPWDDGSDTSVFVNPPYGRALGPWSEKILQETDKWLTGRDTFILTPSRTETDWFGNLFDNAAAVAFFRKRIKFWHPTQPGKQSPKFPNAMFYFGSGADEFEQVFSEAARVVIL